MQDLKDKLKSNDWNLIKETLIGLGSDTMQREMVEAVVECLSHKVWRARKLASDVLVRQLNYAFPVLIKNLRSENNHIRYWCIQILSKAGVRSVPHLIENYEHFGHEDRVFCLRSLASIRDNSCIPFAVRELNNSLWSLRQEAANILMELKAESVPALKELLRNGTDHQRYWAFKLIGSIIQEKAVPTFKTILFSLDYDEKIRSYALTGLKEICSDSAVSLLIQALDCDLWSLRAQASKILMQYPRDCSLALIEALQGDSRAARYWAAQILNENAQEKYLSHLEVCLKKSDPELRYQTISIIAKIQSNNAIASLITMLTDPIWYLRKHAADCIYSMGNLAIQPLLKRMESAMEEELFWICRILGKLGHSSALTGLESLLNHEAKDVRLQALEAIAKIGSEGSIHILLRCFDNEFWVIRSKAAESLVHMGKQTVLPMLRLVHSHSESQSYWIHKTLEDFGLPGVLGIYTILVESSHKDAAMILEQLSQLRQESLFSLYSKYDLQRFHIAEQLASLDNLNPSALFAHPASNSRLDFHPIQRSDYSHEQGIRFQEILKEFRALGGSQLHLRVDSVPMARVNSILCKCTNYKLGSIDIQEFVSPHLSQNEIDSFQRFGHLELSMPCDEREHYKIYLSRSRKGVEAVIQRMRSSIPDFHSLNLPGQFLESIAKLPRGLVLVSGPSSSGKSLTILSILAYINRHFAKSVISLEDQIEYPLHSEKSLISQRASGVCFTSYEEAVRHINREDVDVLYTARMPDYPGSENLLHLASSRTLVFLETNASSTRDAFEKIFGGFPQAHVGIYTKLLQRSLVASLHLRLVNTVDEGEQIPAVEYFFNNSVIQNCLHPAGLDDLQKLLRDSNGESCVGLDDSLLQLASENRISYQEAMRFMEDKSRISISQIW
ncbi:MAG: Flp pilus assembly complex ATPase component TadA [Candidatus Cloacimonetes bacterium]|nr:Flp pilus assembly complex ATPase component TadA [Candidatus Cloacimonadota bacterium]